MPLITLAQIRAVKPLSQNPNSSVERRYNSLIEDSEYRDVRTLLGTKLYQDLVQNSGDANYVTLLTGGSYNFDGFDYDNPGLNRVLIEFAYAKILFQGSEANTPYGLGVKQYDDTVSTERGRAKELMKEQQNVAQEYWIEVRNFLNRNTSDYEFWNDCDNIKRNNNTYRLTHIKGNVNLNDDCCW